MKPFSLQIIWLGLSLVVVAAFAATAHAQEDKKANQPPSKQAGAVQGQPGMGQMT
jgi:hypothetical protein